MDVPSPTLSVMFSVRIVSIGCSSRIGLNRADISYPFFRRAQSSTGFCLWVFVRARINRHGLKPVPLLKNGIGCHAERERERIRVAIISKWKSSAGDWGGQTYRPKCGHAPRVGRRRRRRQLSQLKGRGGRSRCANRGDGKARRGGSS